MRKVKIKNIRDIAKIANRVYNNKEICYLSVPNFEEDIVIRRDDSISSEAITNYYPQLGVYEIIIGKNKDGDNNGSDEVLHELSHIYRGDCKNRNIDAKVFIEQEIEAWLDSSFLTEKTEKRNILSNGQWLVGIANKAMKTYKMSPDKTVKLMKQVSKDIEDLLISDKEWSVILLSLKA